MITLTVPAAFNTSNRPDASNPTVTEFGVGGPPGCGFRFDVVGTAPPVGYNRTFVNVVACNAVTLVTNPTAPAGTSQFPDAPVPCTVNATPAANSLAALGLLRLAALTGERHHADRAEAVLALFGPLAAEHPAAFAHLIAALDQYHAGPTEVVVAGDRPDLLATVRSR